ncbi:hypothetical protein FIBSPDRAFT_905638, partial [Athelia psychrophila]
MPPSPDAHCPLAPNLLDDLFDEDEPPMTCRRCWWLTALESTPWSASGAQQQRQPMPVPRWPGHYRASLTSQREHKAPISLSRCQGGVQKHVEVQIVTTAQETWYAFGNETAAQRRFQNVVELLAASESVNMALALRYQGVGTCEYLVNSRTGKRVFLEINPRIQVEHTIT